jgi:hypothetical protein
MKYYKPRLLAPVAICSWGILVAWITYIYVTQPAIRPLASQNPSAAIPAQLQADIAHATTTWESLQNLLEKESQQRLELTTSMELFPVNKSASGHSSRSLAQGKAYGGGREPVVNMILATRQSRSAMIDGVYVTEGQTLKNGSLVEHIQDDGVMLRDSLGLPRHLPLKNAFEALETPDSSDAPSMP